MNSLFIFLIPLVLCPIYHCGDDESKSFEWEPLSKSYIPLIIPPAFPDNVVHLRQEKGCLEFMALYTSFATFIYLALILIKCII